MAAFRRAATARADATFHDHLKELRTRAFVVVLIFLTAASLAYTYKDPILSFLMKPLGGEKLIYLTPGGGFSFIFQVTLYVGLVAVIPVVMYSVFRFLAPVLERKTRSLSIVVMLASLLLLIMGAGFGYLYAIPAAMNFLIHFADGFANASLTAQSYLSFVVAYTAGLGALFQLPLILLFIHWIRPLPPRKLLGFERYVVLFSFVIAAIISPTPDAVNQLVIALPIIVMYQVGVIAIWVSTQRAKRRARRATRTSDEAVVAQPQSVVPASPPPPARQPARPVATPVVTTPVVAAVPTPTGQAVAGQRRSIDGLRRGQPGVRQRTVAATGRVAPRPATASSPLRRTLVQTGSAGRAIDGVSLIRRELDGTRH